MEEIAATQIETLKKEHGEVFVAKADGKAAYFRKPTRKDLSYAITLRNKPIEMTEVMLRNTFVAGDKSLIDDTGFLLGCSALVNQMIEVKNVEVGKL